jgi:hypothetical protein
MEGRIQRNESTKGSLKGNESNAWALIYDQCTPELKNKLNGTNGFGKAKEDNNVVKLLIMIRSYCCQFDSLNDEYMSIVGALKNLFFFYQKPEQSNSDFHEDFMALVEVIEEYGGGGSLTYFPLMIKKELSVDMDKASADEMKAAKEVVCDKFLAALMLNRANGSKYNELKRSMVENYVTSTSEYPESPEMVLLILNAYQPPPGWNLNLKKGTQDAGGATQEGAMFTQQSEDAKSHFACHNCGEKGHFAWECPKKKEGEQIHANVSGEEGLDKGENIFIQKTKGEKMKGMLNRNYILLDNQSTVDQIANPNLLKNIRKSKAPITVHCNAGSTVTTIEGDLGNMTVQHNPYSIATILSLKSVVVKHCVTYDSIDRGGVF